MCGHSAYDWNTMPMLRLSGDRLTGVGVEHRRSAERDPARARCLQPARQRSVGGLAAPARTEEDEELALLDLEIEVVDSLCRWLPVEVHRHRLDADVGHAVTSLRTIGGGTAARPT
jgi:hypothetical protein